MTPEQLQRLETIEKTLKDIKEVLDISFIKNLERRVKFEKITSDGETVATSITQAVRNAADTGSVNVAAEPDTKLKIILENGDVLYLPAYNS
jgi:hypothetical protein